MSRTTRRGRGERRRCSSRVTSPPSRSARRTVRAGWTAPCGLGLRRRAGRIGVAGRSSANSRRRWSRSARLISATSRCRSTSSALAWVARSGVSLPSSSPVPGSSGAVVASCGRSWASGRRARGRLPGEVRGERRVVAVQVVGPAAEREPARPVDVGRVEDVEGAERGEHRLDPVGRGGHTGGAQRAGEPEHGVDDVPVPDLSHRRAPPGPGRARGRCPRGTSGRRRACARRGPDRGPARPGCAARSPSPSTRRCRAA